MRYARISVCTLDALHVLLRFGRTLLPQRAHLRDRGERHATTAMETGTFQLCLAARLPAFNRHGGPEPRAPPSQHKQPAHLLSGRSRLLHPLSSVGPSASTISSHKSFKACIRMGFVKYRSTPQACARSVDSALVTCGRKVRGLCILDK